MKQLKLSARLFILASVYFIIYNTYFGWNLYPQSAAEQLCDEWWHGLVVVSFILYIWPALEMYENTLRKMDQQKTIAPGDIVYVEKRGSATVKGVSDLAFYVVFDGFDYSNDPFKLHGVSKSKCTLIKKMNE